MIVASDHLPSLHFMGAPSQALPNGQVQSTALAVFHSKPMFLQTEGVANPIRHLLNKEPGPWISGGSP